MSLAMFEVKLLVTDEDEGQEVLGRVRFDGKKITYVDVPDVMIEGFERHGILGNRSKVYKPSDGINFLRNLRFAFSGIALRATQVRVL